MRYSGGKGKIAKLLAAPILGFEPKQIVEPFCGALSMTEQLQPTYASDYSKPIITLVGAVRSGWVPPNEISEEEYKTCSKNRDRVDDPLVAFVGHCTFGGKWYGGLARGHVRQREPVKAAAQTLIRRVRACPNTVFNFCSYQEAVYPDGCLIYCDPPYSGTTNGYAVSTFDSDRFWVWARKMSSLHRVVVSEYSAPEDFVSILDIDCATNVRRLDSNRRTEKLFVCKKSGQNI